MPLQSLTAKKENNHRLCEERLKFSMGPDERHHQEPEQGSDQCNDKSDLSSLLFKDSSEISTTQQDSAYSSQGTSTYSLLAANKQPTGLHSRTATSSTGRVSFRSFKKLSSNPVRIRVTQIQLL